MGEENETGTPPREEEEINVLNIDTILRVISALAFSIRSSWGDGTVQTRLDIIQRLCVLLDTDESMSWYQSIDQYNEEIHVDGRWMRDYWEGPYGDLCYLQDLIDCDIEERYNIEEELFTCFPDLYIADWVRPIKDEEQG